MIFTTIPEVALGSDFFEIPNPQSPSRGLGMGIFHFAARSGDFYPGDWEFFKIWEFISPGIWDFRKSGNFYPGNKGIFIPGDWGFSKIWGFLKIWEFLSPGFSSWDGIPHQEATSGPYCRILNSEIFLRFWRSWESKNHSQPLCTRFLFLHHLKVTLKQVMKSKTEADARSLIMRKESNRIG